MTSLHSVGCVAGCLSTDGISKQFVYFIFIKGGRDKFTKTERSGECEWVQLYFNMRLLLNQAFVCVSSEMADRNGDKRRNKYLNRYAPCISSLTGILQTC